MRIWHEDLIPKLCRQHLLAMWREGLGCWSILVNNKKGYRNHPAVKEFENAICKLQERLSDTRREMICRGYKPKLFIPKYCDCNGTKKETPWQTLEEQIEILKAKGCNCKV